MKKGVLCVGVLCAAMGSAGWAAIPIDDYDNGLVNTQLSAVGDSGLITESVSGVLGGQRISYLAMTTNKGAGTGQLQINVGSSSNLNLNFQNAGGYAVETYEALENANLVSGGTNAFRVLFESSDSPGLVTIVAQTINGGVTNSSTGNITIPGVVITSPTWFDLQFSSMTGTADFSDIDFIQLTLAPSEASVSPDWTVGVFVADYVIPEPGLGLLLLPVLGGVLYLRRRLSK